MTISPRKLALLISVLVVWCLAAAGPAVQPRPSASELTLPNAADSVKFAAIGDSGTGARPQYDIGTQMAAWRAKFTYDTVIMLGDNLYGRQRPIDFVQKFELPFKALLDGGVKFYASLGNHDEPTSVAYKLFNMDGQRYYTYTRKNVRFFALDSGYMDRKQLQWFEQELKNSRSDWKICYFHHPLYSNAARHGAEVELRQVLEPLLTKYGVNVVYSGHDHVYERIKPQKGIHYFVSGAGGQLRKGNLRSSELTAAGFDQDRSFMLNEVDGDQLYFQVISRTGATVDSGSFHR